MSHLPEIAVTANAITVGRRVRLHAGYNGTDGEGVIVAVHGTPNQMPPQTFLGGVGRIIRVNDCSVDVILFDGRRDRVNQCGLGGIGIGYRLLDRVHGPRLVQKARELAANREAAEVLARAKAKRDLADRQRAMKIDVAPVFYFNGIKDAKGEKLQKAHYSMVDYFEKDRIQVLPVHPLYPMVRAAYEAQQAHRERRNAKRG